MDTPGIHKPQDGLGSFMNTNALNSIYGVDIVLLIAPADEKIGKGDRFIVNRLKEADEMCIRDRRIEALTSTVDEMGINIQEETIDGKDCLVLRLPLENLSQQMNSEFSQTAGYSVDKMKALGLEMVMNIKMPGDVESNVGTVDGQNVTIDLLELASQPPQENEIVISSAKEASMDMTYVFVGIGILVVIGFIDVYKRQEYPIL